MTGPGQQSPAGTRDAQTGAPADGTREAHAGAPAGDGQRPSAAHVLEARGLVKTFGHVIGLAGVDLHLDAGEVLGIIGDNGAGKSTLIKCLTGALQPDRGEILLEGKPVSFKSPIDSRNAGIETVYQTLAVAPALDIASNMFLGHEVRMRGPLGVLFRKLDARGMRTRAREQLSSLGITTVQDMTQRLETLSGGQRQAVAVARAAAFGSKVIILDEPTAALGVRESNQVLELIKELRRQGTPVILISHNMPHVFEVADRVHIQRLGQCAGVVTPATTTMEDAVAIMTGAKRLEPRTP
jgi:fructose transport system ATP-binding protein